MRTQVQVPSEGHVLPADFWLDGSGRSEIGVSTLARTQKVAHICSNYLPLTETFIYSFLKNMRTYEPFVLANTMMNVNLFPLQQIVSIPQAPAAERVINKIVRMVGVCPSTQYGYYKNILTKERAGLIHAHFGPTGFKAMELSKGLKLPLVTSFYGVDLSRLPRKWYWRKAYQRLFVAGTYFLTFSKKMRSMLIDLGCPQEKVESCPAGVDIEEFPFRPRALGEGEEIRILLCNRLVEKKGTEYAVRAFAMLKPRVPRCRLTIIGDGPLNGELQSLVSRLKLGPFVEFLGMQPHQRVINELLKAHIFLSPSVLARDGDDEGGINYVVVEAAATGMPLVVTEHASSEIVFNGLSGLIAKDRDEIDLFEKLLFLVENRSIWEKLGSNARNVVESQFSAVTQTQKLEEIYTGLISRMPGETALRTGAR